MEQYKISNYNKLMLVQKYLKENGLRSLIDEFNIDVREYDDRVVLNYNQFDSPRFHCIVDECRALILRKSDWSVLARSFDRFYNWGEGTNDKDGKQRVASNDNTVELLSFPMNNIVVEEKIDGSLMSLYHDNVKWQISTRKMAFAEGSTNTKKTFSEIFWNVADKINLKDKVNGFAKKDLKQYTLIFEMVSPHTRVVTPYPKDNITLIGGRNNLNGNEMFPSELNEIAAYIGVKRPKIYNLNNADDIIEMVNNLPSMQEGAVLLHKKNTGSHWRVKVKNPSFVAIANMRNNGIVSPRRILQLIMKNEQHEYVKYFECDRLYFSFIEEEINKAISRMEKIFAETKNIRDQKKFALTIIPKTIYPFEKGVIFSARKNGTKIKDEMMKADSEEMIKLKSKKIAREMDFQKKFLKNFDIEAK